MIIAVDGPTASGKGTIAKALAAHFGLPHLDTGALYRATALAALRAGTAPDNAAALAAHAAALDLSTVTTIRDTLAMLEIRISLP